MKTSFVILLIVLFSCRQSQSKEINIESLGQRNWKIELPDSLGNLTIKLPTRIDTGFSWIHYSDCGRPCNLIKYRFQAKSSKIVKESGFYWENDTLDPIDRLTVKISQDVHYNDTKIDSNHLLFLRTNFLLGLTKDEPDLIKVLDTIQNIDKFPFIIFGLQKKGNLESRKLFARTYYRGNSIDFCFEKQSTFSDSVILNYFKSSIWSLRTVTFAHRK